MSKFYGVLPKTLWVFWALGMYKTFIRCIMFGKWTVLGMTTEENCQYYLVPYS
jgi:hypothetical protein